MTFPQFKVFTDGSWETVEQVFVRNSGEWLPATGMSVVATVTPYRYSNYNWYKHPGASYELIEGHDPVDPTDPSDTAYRGWGSFWRFPLETAPELDILPAPAAPDPVAYQPSNYQSVKLFWTGFLPPYADGNATREYVIEIYRWNDSGTSKLNSGNPVARVYTDGDTPLAEDLDMPAYEVPLSIVPAEFRFATGSTTNSYGTKWSFTVRKLSGATSYPPVEPNTLSDGGFTDPSSEVKWQIGNPGTIVVTNNYAWASNSTIRRPLGWTAISTFPPTASGTVAKVIDGSDAPGTGTEWIHSTTSTTVYNSTFNRMFANNPTPVWVDLKPPVSEIVSGVSRAISKVRVRQVKVTQYGLIGRNAFGIQSWGEQVMSIERAGGGTIGFISGTGNLGSTGNQWSEVRASDTDIYNYFVSTTPFVKQEYRLGSKTWTRTTPLEVVSESQVIRVVVQRFAPNDLNNPGTSRASIAEISMEYDVYREDGTTTSSYVGQVNSNVW
jgi:hypothetical protein